MKTDHGEEYDQDQYGHGDEIPNVEWDAKAKCKRREKTRSSMRTRLNLKGTVNIQVPNLLPRIVELVRQGYAVNLCGEEYADKHNPKGAAIQIKPAVDGDLKAIHIIAATLGKFKTATSDIKFHYSRNGKDVSKAAILREAEEVRAKAQERREFLKCVSPDSVVTCPQCGTSFRIGKTLTDSKEINE